MRLTPGGWVVVAALLWSALCVALFFAGFGASAWRRPGVEPDVRELARESLAQEGWDGGDLVLDVMELADGVENSAAVKPGQTIHLPQEQVAPSRFMPADKVLTFRAVDGEELWSVPALRDGGAERCFYCGEPEIHIARPDLVTVWLPDGGTCR